jgi:peptidyl-tRNA hydrolase, PTH1 family
MKLLIGLGNPGVDYINTRHNAGFLALDALARAQDGVWEVDDKRQAEIAKIDMNDETVILAKPTTFMNASGEAVQALMSFYKITPSELLVVHDEMDLAAGRLQFKQDGGDAGHNGIASVRERLATDAFARLRIGVGRPADTRMASADYVLEKLSPKNDILPLDTVAAMRDWIEGGMERAMNTWNR